MEVIAINKIIKNAIIPRYINGLSKVSFITKEKSNCASNIIKFKRCNKA